jgi:hypothetical protein
MKGHPTASGNLLQRSTHKPDFTPDLKPFTFRIDPHQSGSGGSKTMANQLTGEDAQCRRQS